MGIISDNLVGRIVVEDIYENKISPFTSIPYLVSEYEKGKFLYENGVSVPKPEGVYRVKNENGNLVPAYVMENMSGYVELAELKGEEEENVKKLRDIELDKVKKLGYQPDDATRNSRNVLWNREKDKVCLIDFETWYKLNRD